MEFHIASRHQSDGATVQCMPGLVARQRSTATTLAKAAFIFQDLSTKGVPLALRISGVTIAWIFFFLSWWKVTRPGQISPATFSLAGIQLLRCILGITVTASVWILYNLTVAITDRRQVAPCIAPNFEKDTLGRTLVLPSHPALMSAQSIIVRVENGNKVYEPEPERDWHDLFHTPDWSEEAETAELEEVLR